MANTQKCRAHESLNVETAADWQVQTVVEVDTPPFAGDGWRLRLENIAKGGKDHYLQLKNLKLLSHF